MYQTPPSRANVAGMSTGMAPLPRQYPCRTVSSQVQPVRGQGPTLPPAVAPAHDLQAAIAPDRQPGPAVAIVETELVLAAAPVRPAVQAVPPDQFRGDLAPCQCDRDAHRHSGSEAHLAPHVADVEGV